MTTSLKALLDAPSSERNSEALWAWVASLSEGLAQGSVSEGDAAQAPLALRKVAQGGLPEAWLDLAAWHLTPLVGEADLDAADAAFLEAMQAEVPTAALQWAQFGWSELRSSLNAAQQRQRFERLSALVAIEPQNAEALTLLGSFSTAGFGTPADPALGLAYQRQAAELLSPQAMFELANHYFRGLGVPVDTQAGLAATQQAASHGHGPAMRTLADFFAQGQFVARDPAQALAWLNQAAQAGDATACVQLASQFALGQPPDREQAAMYLDQAESLGAPVDALRRQLLN